MDIKTDAHTVVVDDAKDSFLVIFYEDHKKMCARLPFLNEIKKEVRESSEALKVPHKPEVCVLNTHIEFTPWNLFDPFPPKTYDDYGYVQFKGKKGRTTAVTAAGEHTTYIHWELLSEELKELVLLVEKKVLEE